MKLPERSCRDCKYWELAEIAVPERFTNGGGKISQPLDGWCTKVTQLSRHIATNQADGCGRWEKKAA